MTAAIEVWSDVGCPFAHVAWRRLVDARDRAGADVVFRHRSFPLELFNRRPTPKPDLDHEMEILEPVCPEAGWRAWSAPEHTYPVTMLPALEALHAASAQSAAAGEQLSLELRRAFFAESQCVSLRHVILEHARRCDAVDADALEAALDSGRYRAAVLDDFDEAREGRVKGSPHLFLPGGEDCHNPGLKLSSGKPMTVVSDDASIYDRLIAAAASAPPR